MVASFILVGTMLQVIVVQWLQCVWLFKAAGSGAAGAA